MRFTLKTICLSQALVGALFASSAKAASATSIEFARDIRPIFAGRCHECHGALKQKSGYRLDRRTEALRGGDSGKPAIVAGNSTASALVARLTSSDKDDVMPPKGERLTADQITQLRAWIDAGAPWSDDAPWCVAVHRLG